MFNLVIKINYRHFVRCFTAHQRYVCYILYEIAENYFIECI